MQNSELRFSRKILGISKQALNIFEVQGNSRVIKSDLPFLPNDDDGSSRGCVPESPRKTDKTPFFEVSMKFILYI